MDSLYSRYANALLSIAEEDKQVETYKNEVKMLKKIILENNEILHLLSSCFILEEEKEKIIDEVFVDVNVNIKNFIKIVVRNKRTSSLIKIFDEFIKTCNEELNVKDGIVYSVNKLEPQEISKIEAGLVERLHCKVELINVVDERLIGGVKVIVEDKIFDGSIKNKLEKLKDSLIAGGN